MKSINEYYEDKYGTIEPYIALKQQVAVICSLLISIIGQMINPLTHILHLITLTIVIHSLYQVNMNFPKKTKKYTAIFTPLYIAAVIAPIILLGYSIPITPTGINYVLFLLIGLLALFIALRTFTVKKGIKAKVILANEDIAVVEPEYDLLAGVKPGKYIVENKGATEKDTVSVKVTRTPFKKPEPKKVKEVIT